MEQTHEHELECARLVTDEYGNHQCQCHDTRFTRIINPASGDEEVRHEVCTPIMFWVTVYRIERLYGGPEEGGWYYDAGEVLASVPIAYCVDTCQQDLEKEKERLMKLFGCFATSRSKELGRFSVLGGGDIEIKFGWEMGRDYPLLRLRYE